MVSVGLSLMLLVVVVIQITLTQGSQSFDIASHSSIRRHVRVQRDNGCQCADKKCSCCQDIKIKKVNLDKEACIELDWQPDQLTATANITFGDSVVYHDTFSAHNPPSLCFGVPGLKKHADLCLNFYDVQIESKVLHACVKLEAKLFRIKVADYDFKCFDTRI